MKFSCQHYGLKFGGMLEDTYTHLFCNLGGVRGCWLAEEWLAARKNEILGFCPVGPHQKKVQFFDHHHCKGKVLTDIFNVESFVSTCLVWGLWLFEWTQQVFPAYAKSGFPSLFP